jgi:hypothetical protein
MLVDANFYCAFWQPTPPADKACNQTDLRLLGPAGNGDCFGGYRDNERSRLTA